MSKQTFIAAKPMTYGTRRLQAGDEFEASRRDGRILKAVGKATDAPAPPAEPVDERPALRAEYETLLGKRPFMGWDADELREKITEAKAEQAKG